MSDSDEALEGSTSKRARRASPNPTVAPRLWKTSNNFVSITAKGLFDHLQKVKKNCKASNGWWHLLKVVHLGDDEPVKIQCTECGVMMSRINPAALGRSHFIPVAAKKHGWQSVTTYDEARTNSKGHVQAFLKHANIAGMRQKGFNMSFAIYPGFVVLGDALLPVAGPATIDSFKAYNNPQ